MIFTRNYSELLFSRRVDAELYNPKYLSSLLFLKKKGYNVDPLSRIAIIKSGTTPTDRNDELKTGPILFKTTDIRNATLDPQGDFYHIAPNIHARMWNTRIKGEDILLNIVGATLDVIGRSAYVPETFPESNITQAMVSLSVYNPKYKPGYIFSYLQTYFAQDQIKRIARPTGQFNLNHPEVGAIELPCLSESFQKRIDQIIKQAAIHNIISSESFTNAKQIFLSSLGLENWEPNHVTSYRRTFSKVQNCFRIDAEHFQPKFCELLKIIHENAQYCKSIRTIKTFNQRGAQPKYFEDGTLNVINSQHILETHLDYDNFEKTDVSFWDANLESRVFKNDILIYTTGANIGRANVYLQEDKAVASNHTNILRVKDENPIYVGFALNSIVGRMQTEKMKTGSAQAEIYPSAFNQFVIPFIDKKKQEQIVDLYIQSYEMSKESKQLIIKAKKTVEIAIEQDENVAIRFFNEK